MKAVRFLIFVHRVVCEIEIFSKCCAVYSCLEYLGQFTCGVLSNLLFFFRTSLFAMFIGIPGCGKGALYQNVLQYSHANRVLVSFYESHRFALAASVEIIMGYFCVDKRWQGDTLTTLLDGYS
jgi:hypothetical protein